MIRMSLNTELQKVKKLKANPDVPVYSLDPANSLRRLKDHSQVELLTDTNDSFTD